MNKLFSLFLLIFLLGCSSCAKQKKNTHKEEKPPVRTAVDIPLPNQKNSVVLKIDGVECPLCAQLAVDQLKKIDGIENPVFRAVEQDYENGYVHFIWNKETNIPLKQLSTLIQVQGFSIKQVNGLFVGKFLYNYEKRQLFSFEDVDLSFLVSISNDTTVSIPVDDKNWASLLEKNSVCVQASLYLTEDAQSYIFVPKRILEQV